MEAQSSPPCPQTATVRRNPYRKARATPSTNAPPPRPISNHAISEIPSFPIQDILAVQVPQTPSPSSTENLRVFLRIRPLNIIQGSGKSRSRGNQSSKPLVKNAWPQNPTAKIKRLKEKKSESCIVVNDTQSVTLSLPSRLKDPKRIKSEVYEGFSHVFSAESSQEEVYERMVNPLVKDFINGKSGMLAAMGPSGSGKTHTVFGCPREPGMVPLALKQIFNQTEGNGSKAIRSFYISMFEICSERGKVEKLLDLSPGGADLFMQQSSIKGLQEVIISDAAQAESFIAQGMLKRSTAMTNSNSQSSRSQCIINIRCASNNLERGVDVQMNSAVLTIVDLAGAEREKRTGNQGSRLLESNFINNTSMVFGLCLRSLLEHQRNPKKLLQKHFQNSMLTRYLRDYLEGRKRMALILTVKPGEEDYLDTSFLLKQASPFMKIKFHNVEELPDMVPNKRRVQILPRFEQCKRMKFSNTDACEIEEGNSVGDDEQLVGCDEEVNSEQLKGTGTAKAVVQFPINSKLDLNYRTLIKVSDDELAKIERNSQIMQGFAKALWNVLKQYKQKLKEAECQVQNLRESLKSEKTKTLVLDKELKDLRSHCSCHKQLVELSSSQLTEDDSSQLEAHGFSNVDEVESSDMSDSCRLCIKDILFRNSQGDHRWRRFMIVESSDLVDSNHLCIKDIQSQNSQGISSSDVMSSERTDSELKHNAFGHCSFPKNRSAEDLKELEYLEVDDSHLKAKVTGNTKLLKPLFCSSKSLFEVNDKISPLELDQLHNTEEVKILLDPPPVPKEEVAVISKCNADNVPESEAELSSCNTPLLDPPLMPRENDAVTCVCSIGDVPESETEPICFSELLSDLSPRPNEDVAITKVGDNGDMLETEIELSSCSKPLFCPSMMPKEDIAVKREYIAANVLESESGPNYCSKGLLYPQEVYYKNDGVAAIHDTDDLPESEAEVNSCSKPLLAPQLMPKEEFNATQAYNSGNVLESEAEVNSCSKSLFTPQLTLKEDVDVTQVCNTRNVLESESEVNSCSKALLAPQPMPKEDVDFRPVCNPGNKLGSEAEVNSCSKQLLAPLTPKENIAVTQVCKTRNVVESEAEVNSCSKALLAPQLMPKEDVDVTRVCDTGNELGSESEVNSCSKALLALRLMPEEDVDVTRVCRIGNELGGEAEVNSCTKQLMPPQPMSKEDVDFRPVYNPVNKQGSEAEVNSCSEQLLAPLIPKENVAVTQVCKTRNVVESEAEVNSCSKELLALQLMPEEDVDGTGVCHTGNELQSEADVNSGSKRAAPLMPNENGAVTRVFITGNVLESDAAKTEKPRRRLLPASSVLSRDIGGLDLEDGNQKPRGTRGGKKLAADEISRTHGSISLMRLLKSNLRH